MSRPLTHWLLLFALVAMWGSAFMMTGVAVRGFTPATLVAIRLVIAAALLGGLDQLIHAAWPDGRRPSLRRVLFDLLEEYGRHTGHADMLREAVDGRVGEDPPDGWRPA